MALKTTSFLLILNILFFNLVTSDQVPEVACPVNGLKFGVCAGVLNNTLNGVALGTPPTIPCCGLFFNLFNFEAATCLCRAIKANILGVNLDASASLSLVLNNCGKEVPAGFRC